MAGKQSVGGRAAPDGWLAGALGGEDSGLGGGESAPAWSTALLDAVSDAGERRVLWGCGYCPTLQQAQRGHKKPRWCSTESRLQGGGSGGR